MLYCSELRMDMSGLFPWHRFPFSNSHICLKAVSYTHLDVYKRQVISTAKGFVNESTQEFIKESSVPVLRLCPGIWKGYMSDLAYAARRLIRSSSCLIPMSSHGFSISALSCCPSAAVSYTHLDVYKRQETPLPINSPSPLQPIGLGKAPVAMIRVRAL